jgi:hypothetical protein
VLTLVTGPAWTTSTAGAGARGSGGSTTQLARIKGYNVNAVAMTGRNGATTYAIGANLATYVGSGFIDSVAGQISCHRSYGQSRKWGLWNAFNRKPIYLKAGDSTASWTYTSPTIRPSNNSTANSLTTFTGLAEEFISLTGNQKINGDTGAGAGTSYLSALGVNSTTVTTGTQGNFLSNSAAIGAIGCNAVAMYDMVPGLGINTITMLESSPSPRTGTWFGTESFMLLKAMWRG